MATEKVIPREVPRYRVAQKCYMNDRIYDPESMPLDQNADVEEGEERPRKPLLVNFEGVPGPHLVPVNGAAKAMVAKYSDRMQYDDPIDSMTVVGSGQQPAPVVA